MSGDDGAWCSRLELTTSVWISQSSGRTNRPLCISVIAAEATAVSSLCERALVDTRGKAALTDRDRDVLPSRQRCESPRSAALGHGLHVARRRRRPAAGKSEDGHAHACEPHAAQMQFIAPLALERRSMEELRRHALLASFVRVGRPARVDTYWKRHMLVQEEQANELLCQVVRRKSRQDRVRDISDVIDASETGFPLCVEHVRYIDIRTAFGSVSCTYREQAVQLRAVELQQQRRRGCGSHCGLGATISDAHRRQLALDDFHGGRDEADGAGLALEAEFVLIRGQRGGRLEAARGESRPCAEGNLDVIWILGRTARGELVERVDILGRRRDLRAFLPFL